jgi:hypothetical protein
MRFFAIEQGFLVLLSMAGVGSIEVAPASAIGTTTPFHTMVIVLTDNMNEPRLAAWTIHD